MHTANWVNFSKDQDTGIESIRAHFEGHAFDPHWHDTYAVGLTEQGVQRFHARRKRHVSTPGRVILLEPGEVHDGVGPEPGGFTYRLLYLDPQWLSRSLVDLFEQAPPAHDITFAATMSDDPGLAHAIGSAFETLHTGDIRMARQAALDNLLDRLTRNVSWRATRGPSLVIPALARQAREYLHDHMTDDPGLDDLAVEMGTDRFRLSRAFKAAFGLAPHAYLVQLRLTHARRLLAGGMSPADVAASVGFADQSHLGRWFRRAYALTPAQYRRLCSKVPD